jgi:hypothetical protein
VVGRASRPEQTAIIWFESSCSTPAKKPATWPCASYTYSSSERRPTGGVRQDPGGGPGPDPLWLMLDLTPDGRGVACGRKIDALRVYHSAFLGGTFPPRAWGDVFL